jgi:PGF-pre-PGF domain-containing protein
MIDSSIVNTTTSSSLGYTYSTSSVGTHKVNCTSYDLADNTNSTNASITVSSAGNGGSGGNGGDDGDDGDGSTTPTTTTNVTIYSRTYTAIDADEEISFSPSSSFKKNLQINEIVFSTSINFIDVKFTLKILEEDDVSEALENVYKYFEITAVNLDDNYLNEASIEFEIEKSWFDDYNVSTVELRRYFNNEWTKTGTELTDEDSNSYTFIAYTPGFSDFAITAKPLYSPIPLNITIPPVSTSAQQNLTGREKLFLSIFKPETLKTIALIVTGLIILGVIVAIILIWRQRRGEVVISHYQGPVPQAQAKAEA